MRQAQDTAQDTERAVLAARVVHASRSYVREFNAGDIERCVEHYSFPFSYVSALGITWVQSRQEFLETWKTNHARMKSRGWARSDYIEHNVSFLGGGVALESHVLARYDAADREIERTGSTFVMRREGDAWRITSCLQHTPDDVLRTGVAVPAVD